MRSGIQKLLVLCGVAAIPTLFFAAWFVVFNGMNRVVTTAQLQKNLGALPRMQDRLTQVISFGTDALRQSARTRPESHPNAARFLAWRTLVKSDVDQVASEWHPTAREDAGEDLPANGSGEAWNSQSAAMEYVAAGQALCSLMDRLQNVAGEPLTETEFRVAGERALTAGDALMLVGSGQLNAQIDSSRQSLAETRNEGICLFAFALLNYCVLAVYVVGSWSRRGPGEAGAEVRTTEMTSSQPDLLAIQSAVEAAQPVDSVPVKSQASL